MSFPSSRRIAKAIAFLLLLCTLRLPASAYSVLSHEAIVDLAWDQYLKPLLLKKYPSATPDELVEAHAYAYGGCVIQDMGYYPFGNKQFSDLVHYVRSGDFVMNLLNEAQNLDEYAFALGALAHYTADIGGHPAVNRAVPLEFPKLERKYGKSVTYEEDKQAHIRTEFGFDVAQVAKERYAPKAYHDFIGFEVSKPVLERAFQNTYGIELKDLFRSLDLSIGTFRRSVSTIIPEMTKVALLTKQNVAVTEKNDQARRQFIYHLSRASYEKEWGKEYERPGVGARFLALLFRLVPKVGPFKAINFKVPSPQTEDLYLKSVDEVIHRYEDEIMQTGAGTLKLADVNFDTSQPTRPGQYNLTDDSYALLVHKLAEKHFQELTPDLKDNVLSFYSSGGEVDTRNHPKEWRRLQQELADLKTANPVPPAPAQAVASAASSPDPKYGVNH